MMAPLPSVMLTLSLAFTTHIVYNIYHLQYISYLLLKKLYDILFSQFLYQVKVNFIVNQTMQQVMTQRT